MAKTGHCFHANDCPGHSARGHRDCNGTVIMKDDSLQPCSCFCHDRGPLTDDEIAEMDRVASEKRDLARKREMTFQKNGGAWGYVRKLEDMLLAAGFSKDLLDAIKEEMQTS